MSANVDSMFSLRETPWHGLGRIVQDALTSEQAIVEAGLNWEVEKRNLFVANPFTNEAQTVPGYKAITRIDNNDVLAIMGEKYQTFQNREAFSFFDTVVGEKLAMYHTAGSLDGGRKIWLLAKVPGDIRIAGTDDIVEKFLMLATSHDGSLSVVMKPTSVRVVCQNTLNAALSEKTATVKVRHTRNMEAKVTEAQRILGFAQKSFEHFNERVQFLAKKQLKENEIKVLVERLFPANAEGEVATRTLTNRSNVINLFENGTGANMSPGSAWNFVNAVTEYVDHSRGTRIAGEKSAEIERESRLSSAWFGSGETLKAQAWEAVNEVALAA